MLDMHMLLISEVELRHISSIDYVTIVEVFFVKILTKFNLDFIILNLIFNDQKYRISIFDS